MAKRFTIFIIGSAAALTLSSVMRAQNQPWNNAGLAQSPNQQQQTGPPAAPAPVAAIRSPPTCSTLPMTSRWATHGSCVGVSAEQYFATVRQSRDSVHIPAQLASPTQTLSESAAQIEAQFAAANPDFPKSAFRATCANGKLQEARICLDKNLKPQPEFFPEGQRRKTQDIDAVAYRVQTVAGIEAGNVAQSVSGRSADGKLTWCASARGEFSTGVATSVRLRTSIGLIIVAPGIRRQSVVERGGVLRRGTHTLVSRSDSGTSVG